MNDTTVLITGATSGLGRQLAHQFAQRGWHVIAHGRDRGRLTRLTTELSRYQATVSTHTADMTEPDEVIRLCSEVKQRHTRLDLVVNNAAVGGGTDPTRREINSRGTEKRMAGNYLAPHLINRELIELVKVPKGRMVNVASIGQLPLDVTDLNFEHDYEGVTAYCRSKLAMIMDTIDLAAQIEPSGITVNAVHPAHLMATTMVRDSGFVPERTLDDGLLPVLRVALDTHIDHVTGAYFDRFDIAAPHQQATVSQVREKLAVWASMQW